MYANTLNTDVKLIMMTDYGEQPNIH